MPPLRNSTSFAERVGLARPERSPWKRSLSHPTHLQSPKPKSLPVSEVTRNKLDKFKYQSPETVPAAEENNSISISISNTNTNTNTRNVRSKRSGSPTPLTRLDWKDLVEPCDPQADAAERSSPNGKLLWNNKHDPGAFPAISPMMAGRKRARSSSPPMSPSPADRFRSPVPAVKVNVEQLAKALKSPHPDPTLELWDRYSLRGPEGGQAGAAAAAPTLAQLMVSASPSPRRGKNVPTEKGDLRRAMSCGLLWPKRRRTERLSAGVDGAGQRELEAASKSSLVSALLDSVTSSIQDQTQDQDQDQAEDDLDLEPALDSPSMRKGRAPPPPAPAPEPKESKESKESNPPRQRSPSPLSDYGDDDLDDDFLELEAQIQASQRTERELPAEEPELPRMPGTEPPPRLETETTRPLAKGKDDLDDLDDLDDFDDNIFDDVDDIFDGLDSTGPAANESERSNAANSLHQQRVKSIQRYLIKSVLDGEYVDQWERAVPEKILLIQADNSTESRAVHLRGAWFDTPAHTDCYVHVIGEFSPKGQCIVDDSQNLLILHPDQLVSSTVVADSFGCMRRAVLQDRVKATGEASPPLVYGTMLHEIFQEALLANRWDLAFLARVIDTIIDKHIEDLYTIKVGLASAREHLQSKMTELSFWAKSFVAAEPRADAIVEGRHGEKAKMAVRKLLDVEEHVWSPMYGLKGNIDATVEVMMTDMTDMTDRTDRKKSQILTVPFEVKTGKHANSNHMAQTALYSLLLSDRYDINIASGILYYMETSRTMRIPAVRHELRHMIMQRNELACYIRERSVQLPPMLKNRHMCGRCYAQTSCFTYHCLADDGDGETSGMGNKFDEAVDHLTPKHQEFFIKWENLLTMEEKESQKNKRELWTMTSAQREKRSRCFGDVIIEPGSTASVEPNDSRVNRFGYTFVKRNPTPDFTFIGSEITTGEPVVVSDEEGHYALAIGFVTSLQRGRISVAVDRRLHNARIRQPGFDEVDNQAFASIMEVPQVLIQNSRSRSNSKSNSKEKAEEKAEEPLVRYRLDRDEFSNGMSTVRNNLVQLMANDVPAAAQIRRLIVDLVAPRFKTAPTQYTVTVTDGESLNVDQKRAIEKVMSAQDYALVLGMPGTGKTTTIAHIIRALVSQGKTVLLTSHTHTAVDNILLKLKTDKTPILRLGAPAKIHPEVRDFAHLAGQPKKTFEEIEQTWHGTPIVATTCLGINHQIFVERAFDYCIVDEASQITLPICAGPIRLARTFVLVGDHNQLPPVVKNGEARDGGLDVSLFKLLSDAHPQSVVNLEHQYRMCEDIMTLSNTLIYEGKLRCGTEELRRRKLQVPNMSALKQHHYDASTILLHQADAPRTFCTGNYSSVASRCWLHDLLDGEARARFVDTDTIQPPVREEAQGSRIVNHVEAQIVTQLVESLLTVGVPATEIGVMTHYRSQLSLLKEKLKMHSGEVEMHTTDRFQGRDKEVVVLSLVRSNEACNIGELLKDWRRINVAFTRAKTKLLVVGSMRTLRDSGEGGMLSRFIALMERRDWIYHLPGDALVGHYFEEGQASQWTGTGTGTGMGMGTQRRVVGMRRLDEASGKENQRPGGGPRRVGPGEKVLLKERLITRDILNEMTGGVL